MKNKMIEQEQEIDQQSKKERGQKDYLDQICNILSKDEKIELLINSQQFQNTFFDSSQYEQLIRSCGNILNLAFIYQQKLINTSQNKRVFREKVKELLSEYIEENSLYHKFLIVECLRCNKQEDFNINSSRIRAIIKLLLDFSEDMMLFYYIYEVLIKALTLTLNYKSIVLQDETQILITQLLTTIDKEKNIFYWQTLMDVVFEISGSNITNDMIIEPNLVAQMIIANIPSEYITKLMNYIGQYLVNVQILHQGGIIQQTFLSLTQYGLNKSNINLISRVSQILYQKENVQKDQMIKWFFEGSLINQLYESLFKFTLLDELLDLFVVFFCMTSQHTQPQLLETIKESLVKIIDKFSKILSIEYQEQNLQAMNKKKIQDFLLKIKGKCDYSYGITQFKKLYDQLDQKVYKNGSYLDVADNKYNTGLKWIGIRNINNTCYFNSFIQGIFMTAEFRQLILQSRQKQNFIRYLQNGDDLLTSIQKVFSFLEYVNEDVDLCPIAFKQSLREPYRSQSSQQDAGEFGTQFFEDLEFQMKGQFKEVKDIFIGQTQNQLLCLKCNYTTTGPAEDFLQLTLNFPQKVNEYSKIQIQELIHNHQIKEIIDMVCDHCNDHSRCHKTQDFVKLPQCLIIMLNRFQFNNGKKTKILTPVNLDPQIQIKIGVKQYTYYLYAFIVHEGISADSGHYYTYAKQVDTWILFNDSQATATNIESAIHLQQTPYILFYKKQKQQ